MDERQILEELAGEGYQVRGTKIVLPYMNPQHMTPAGLLQNGRVVIDYAHCYLTGDWSHQLEFRRSLEARGIPFDEVIDAAEARDQFGSVDEWRAESIANLEKTARLCTDLAERIRAMEAREL